MAYTIKNFISSAVKYDPDGNRIFKDSSETGRRKYIVDIAGDLPVILMELNNSGDIVKTYIYANSQIIAQHTGDHEADRYFYLHDRLGSVRQIIDTSGNVKNRYTYDPFGELYPAPDFEETVDNPFKFTGQYFDSEIDQYYLRARQYDPHIARFTARDPVFGKFQEPLTLHVYLYCLNTPVNRTDPTGNIPSLIALVWDRSWRSALRGMVSSALQSSVRAALDPRRSLTFGEFFVDVTTGTVKGFFGGIVTQSPWFGNLSLTGQLVNKYILDTFLDTAGAAYKSRWKGEDVHSLIAAFGGEAMCNFFSSPIDVGIHADFSGIAADLGSDAWKFIMDLFEYVGEEVLEENLRNGESAE